MRVRGAIAGTRLRLTVAGLGTMTVLASGALSACSGSTPIAGPSSFSPAGTLPPTAAILPSGTASGTATASPSGSASPPASPSASEPGSASASPHRSPKAPSSPSPRPAPTAAPATGGGGTAGLQDAWLLALGGVAVLAGAGSLAYRRRVMRNR
jgi:hypothetical protein